MESSKQSGLQPTPGTTPGAPPSAPEAEGNAYAFPLTFVQQRLWFLAQLEKEAASYNVPWAMRIEGALDIALLERTLSEIVARHETLRTTFTLAGNEPVQVVHPAAPVKLPITDISGLQKTDREAEAKKLAQDEAVRPMDLVRGPLLRTSLIRLGGQEHILLLTLHHIVFDAWSRRIFVRELGTIYEALSAGKPSPLPELQLQYADYAVWQRGQLSGNTLERHLAYWRKQLEAAPSHLELPTDRPRPAAQSFAGAVCAWKAPAELVQQLTALSRTAGTTLFMTLLAAFNVLLAKYSGQEDVVIGTPIANRNRAEIEALIGFFTNTLVLRTDVSGDPTFLELLPRVKETALGAYAHQDMPFEKLVEELKPERSLGFNPLFQVLFSLQNSGTQSMQLPGLQLTTLERTGTTSKFDLSLFLTETEEGLRGGMEYSTDLFDASTVEQMLRHYEKLLRAIVEAPKRRISQLSLLTEAETQHLLRDFNATEVAYPRDVPLNKFLEDQAQRTPRATAVVFESQELSYEALNARANQLAHWLRQHGVGPDVLVGVCAERSLELVIALVGIVKAGGAYVPLDPDYPADRLRTMLEDANPPVLLTQERLLSRIPAMSPNDGSTTHVLCLDRDWNTVVKQSTANLPLLTNGKNLAYAIYTSGSTGKPKGVPNTHEGIVNRLLWMQDAYKLTTADRVLQKTPYSFDVSVWEFFWPLMTGACVVVARPNGHKDPSYLVDLIQKQNITTLHFVPSMLAIFLEAQGVERCRSIRQVFASGEALSYELQQKFFQRLGSDLSEAHQPESGGDGPRLHNLYGPTEAAVDVTYWNCDPSSSRQVVPIGRPVANTQIYILDRFLQPVPIGVAGELHIGGVQLARGYLNRPDLTAEKFIPDPFDDGKDARLYKTGDLARYMVDGTIEYLGRMDHQVKLRGFRIELGEIEAALQQHESVQQCLVMAREDQPGQPRLVAYCIARMHGSQAASTNGRASNSLQSVTLSPELLREHLRRSLPEFMIPSAFVPLDAFPLTPSGKVNRKALPAPEQTTSGSDDRLAARDDIEYLVFRIWATVLGTEAIGIRDNFFDVGGHSLLAVRMMQEIQKATGKELPLSLLFQGATIEKLAAIIQEGEDLPPCPTLLEIQRGNATTPPYFAVATPGVNALGYVTLARHLGKDQPLYKLQKYARARTTLPYSPEDFEALASEYIQAMREIQPKGPYYLGGMCEGARIAYDMARILEAQGEKVALLAVLDTWVVEHTQIRTLGNLHYYRQRWRRFRSKSWTEQKQEFLEVMGKKLRRGRSGVLGTEKAASPKHTWNDHYWPKNFVSPKYSGDILVLKRPRQPYYYVRDPLLGWGNRTSGTVEAVHINSPHSFVLREPYVTEVGKLLSQALAKLTGRKPLPASDEQPATSADPAAVVYSR